MSQVKDRSELVASNFPALNERQAREEKLHTANESIQATGVD